MALPNYKPGEVGARAWYPAELLPKMVRELVGHPDEVHRKAEAHKRVALYTDDKDPILVSLISTVFDEAAVRAKFRKFLRVAKNQAPFKRVIDLVSRPVYAIPPVRIVEPEIGQANFEAIAKECRLNDRLDMVTRLANACNHVLVYPCYKPSLDRIELDILTPDMFSVITNPESPLTALAIIYEMPVMKEDGSKACYQIYTDDLETFVLDENGRLVPGTRRDHGYYRMPFTWAHRTERWGKFFDTTSGADLVAADEQCALLVLLAMRLLKTQGFNQLLVSGDTANISKEQVLDEENALVAGPDVNISKLETKTDAAHYLAMLEGTKLDAAANRGVSKARLNEDISGYTGFAQQEVGLMEERAEAVKMMQRVEEDLFEVLKMVSIDRGLPIPEDATIKIDFPELISKYDRKTELEIADIERKAGLRNFLDDIKRLNPEIRNNSEAEAEFVANIKINTEAYQLLRELNLSSDADAEDPGKSAEENGAKGPAVRDGEMSKDAAAG